MLYIPPLQRWPVASTSEGGNTCAAAAAAAAAGTAAAAAAAALPLLNEAVGGPADVLVLRLAKVVIGGAGGSERERR